MLQVYDGEEKCCGCGACANVCPKHAIVIKENKLGFWYPVINQKECIDCKLCKKACIFGKSRKRYPDAVYAAVNIDSEKKKYSSSAGIFSAVAEKFLNENNIVVGAAAVIENGNYEVRHELISRSEDVKHLQGSKYVQSKLECYDDIKQQLIKGKKILFSGTPCQVAEIKHYFKEYQSQIYTIDIICHGVPNQQFLNNYLKRISKQYCGQIKKVSFRDKQYGWGVTGSLSIERNKVIEKHLFEPDTSSYYSLFLDGEIYRESCYYCPYADKERVGDLTIGDYWGVEKYSPELLVENGGNFNAFEGVSCVLCNSKKGSQLLECSSDMIQKELVDIEKILIINHQLRCPAKHTMARNRIFKQYEKSGYGGVEKVFGRIQRKKKMIGLVKNCIPKRLKRVLKEMKH